MNKIKNPKSLKTGPPLLPVAAHQDLEAQCQFELELCWCVQQLENAQGDGKFNKKLHENAIKSLKTLKSNTVPAIKKRQVMTATFGDYRSKMKEEEKKLGLVAKKIKFTPNDEIIKKSSFVKKAAIQTSGREFKFNFNPETSVDEPCASEGNINANNMSSHNNLDSEKNANMGSSDGFKFNFVIEDENENQEINFEKLAIKG